MYLSLNQCIRRLSKEGCVYTTYYLWRTAAGFQVAGPAVRAQRMKLGWPPDLVITV